MTLKDIVKVSRTSFEVYVGYKVVYSRFNGGHTGVLTPLLDKEVLWLDAGGDDIILIGIEGDDKDEEK